MQQKSFLITISLETSSSLALTIFFLKLECKKKELSYLHIGIGPGSYTGIRVAVAAMEGLQLSLSIPLYSFPSLLAFIPKEHPKGPFYFLWESKLSSHILMQGTLKEDGLSLDIAIKNCTTNELPVLLNNASIVISNLAPNSAIRLPPSIQILPPSPNLPLLVSFLLQQESLPPKKLSILYPHQPHMQET